MNRQRTLVKVADFGISKQMSSDEQFAKTKIGTQSYMPPEIRLGWSEGPMLSSAMA